jgi:hypothetical protein
MDHVRVPGKIRGSSLMSGHSLQLPCAGPDWAQEAQARDAASSSLVDIAMLAPAPARAANKRLRPVEQDR